MVEGSRLRSSTTRCGVTLWRIAAAVTALAGLLGIEGCTVFIAGKDATVDGSVLVSHSNDGELDTDPRLVKIPAVDYPEDSLRPVFFSPESYPRYVGRDRGVPEYYPSEGQKSFVPMGHVPQVRHTFAYLEDTYGAVNEHGVGIGESTCSGVFGSLPLGTPSGTALLSVDELSHLAMERATTSREAVTIMGALAEKYGFYGAGAFEGTAESLGVTDPNEAWIFHILPDPTGKSAIWAAQRLADDGFAVIANMFVLRELNPKDTENFLMSDSVHTVAKHYGWWDDSDGSLLDFTEVYSDGEYAHKYYSGRRMWGAYHLAAPSKAFPAEYTDLQSDPVYPVYTTPDEPLSLQHLFKFHRYTYQGTKYDLGGENLASGPFGSPDRWTGGSKDVQGNWERPIGLFRTSDTYVVQSRKHQDAVLWFGPASSLGTVFTPFTPSLSDIPLSFRSGHQAVFSRESAFWAACAVHNVAQLKYDYAIKDIQKLQQTLEIQSLDMVKDMDLKMEHLLSSTAHSDNKRHLVIADVETAYLQNADNIVKELWSLVDKILFKYANGFVNDGPNDTSQTPFYPDWWLRKVGYQNGPPPPPTKPKCCSPVPLDHRHHHHHHHEEGATLRGGLSQEQHQLHSLTGKEAMKHYLKTNSMS